MGVIKIVTPQKMSLERETFIYMFSIPNMEKSHAFLEVRLGFFNCIDDTHNRFQFHTQSKKNIQFSGSFNFFVGQFQRSDCYQIRI